MIGTLLNVAGLVAGGLVGLTRWQPLTPAREAFFRVGLAVFTVWYGLQLTWKSVNGPFLLVLKQIAIIVLALMIGKILGRLLRLQPWSNRLGQFARQHLEHPVPNDPQRAGKGFKVCAALYCAAPLGVLGSIQDGLSDYFYPLAVKGVMEGLATMGFARLFGPGVLLSALPVLAFQGTLTLLCAHFCRPFLADHLLLDSVNATGGMLVFTVALVMLELKKLELADYLPSLVAAPLLTWMLR